MDARILTRPQSPAGATAGNRAATPRPVRVDRRRFLAAVAAAGAGLAAPRLAAGPAAPWSMAAMEHFPPYNYLSDGRFVGIDIDILDEAAREMGVTMLMRPLPWRRAILAFRTGAADGLFQLTLTPARERTWHMAGPLRTTRLVFMVLDGAALDDVPTLDALAGQVVGTVNGFTYGPAFDGAEGIVREGSMDDETSVRKLILGRATVILGGEANLLHAAGRLGVRDRVRILPTPLEEQPRYAAFRRDAAGGEKAAMLQAVLARMTADGRIDRILHNHGKA